MVVFISNQSAACQYMINRLRDYLIWANWTEKLMKPNDKSKLFQHAELRCWVSFCVWASVVIPGLWILYCADDQIAQNIDFWEQIHE